MDFKDWYDQLNKPDWTPEPSMIGAIWSILYPIIFAVNIYVWSKYFQRQLSFAVALPFLINLVANLSFTPVQFGLRNLDLAAFIIVIIFFSTAWCIVAVWPTNRIAALAFIPYLIWVGIATILQIFITLKN
jgi:translocator protein